VAKEFFLKFSSIRFLENVLKFLSSMHTYMYSDFNGPCRGLQTHQIQDRYRIRTIISPYQSLISYNLNYKILINLLISVQHAQLKSFACITPCTRVGDQLSVPPENAIPFLRFLLATCHKHHLYN